MPISAIMSFGGSKDFVLNVSFRGSASKPLASFRFISKLTASVGIFSSAFISISFVMLWPAAIVPIETSLSNEKSFRLLFAFISALTSKASPLPVFLMEIMSLPVSSASRMLLPEGSENSTVAERLGGAGKTLALKLVCHAKEREADRIRININEKLFLNINTS